MMWRLIDILTGYFGFELLGSSDDCERAAARTWHRTGPQGCVETYKVVVRQITGTAVRVHYFRDGVPVKNKIYDSSYSRALSGIRASVKSAGYEMEAMS